MVDGEKWKLCLRQSFTDSAKLCDFLQLEESLRARVLSAPKFPLRLPLRIAAKISKNTLEDPLLLQFLPLEKETVPVSGFIADPVCDLAFQKSSKLLHKYQGRALLLMTSACAMHCRYCFRQNFPYEKEQKGFETELQQIRQDPSLTEIILSGGDPLSLDDRIWKDLLHELDQIPSLQRLRIHTRFPIGIPERINSSFLDILAKSRLQIFFVIHCNHPRELDVDILSALKQVQKLGIPVLNQAVLLRNINDSLIVLEELCQTLINAGVLPYYLHQLDRVQGASHFEVSPEVGRQLIQGLEKRLPGYGVPKYVQEIAGKPHKMSL